MQVRDTCVDIHTSPIQQLPEPELAQNERPRNAHPRALCTYESDSRRDRAVMYYLGTVLGNIRVRRICRREADLQSMETSQEGYYLHGPHLVGLDCEYGHGDRELGLPEGIHQTRT